MKYNFIKDGYEIVKGAISKEVANLSYDYLKLKSKCVNYYYENKFLDKEKDVWYWGGFGDDLVSSENTYFTYSDIFLETIMSKIHTIMEEKTNLNLLPTFSYARIYKLGNQMHKHKDGNIGKVTSTMNLGGAIYPIYITDTKKNEPIKIELEPGDMLIYKGEEFEHYRLKLEEEECAQAFFLYVPATQENLKYLFDGRPHMGLSSITSEFNK